MADQYFLDLIKQGSTAWNKWRKKYPEIPPDLSEVDFSGVELVEANFREVNFHKANLARADLTLANLADANLSETNLSNACFTGVDFSYANLEGARLLNAFLEGAYLYKANLAHADLSDAYMDFSVLSYANLYRARLLDTHLEGADLTFANLHQANLHGASLHRANLRNAKLMNAWLTSANLSEADISGADLTGCSVYATSAWKIQSEGSTQSGLIITPPYEPTLTVDNLEIAQFIYLLLEHKKLRNVVNAVAEKGVLLLGRFSDGGLELLQFVAAKLRESKYLPMIFDFDRPENRDYTETVKTLIGLSRFVIVDLSGPSVPQELYATVPHFNIPFIPILQEGTKEYSMFRDLLKYPWVIKPIVEFKNTEHLMELLPSRIIAPAEEKSRERQEQLMHLFNR